MSIEKDREEAFIARWSRMKRAPEEPAPLPAAPEPAPDAEGNPEKTDAEILADLDLKHPSELMPGDDIRGFLEKAVPEHLRRLALKTLWRSNPVLANVDGLVDYGEDFTDAATVIPNMQTLYQVGKGMFRPPLEPEEPDEEAVVAEELAEEEPVEEAEDEEVEVQVTEVADTLPEPEMEPPAPTPRRMTFSFADG